MPTGAAVSWPTHSSASAVLIRNRDRQLPNRDRLSARGISILARARTHQREGGCQIPFYSPSQMTLRKAGNQEKKPETRCTFPAFLHSSAVIRRANRQDALTWVHRSNYCREAALHAERSLGGVVGAYPSTASKIRGKAAMNGHNLLSA